MESNEEIDKFIRRSRLQRAAALLERKLEPARARKQKSVTVPLKDAQSIIDALRG